MTDIHHPAADWELRRVIADAAHRREPIEIVGSGSRRTIGRPIPPMAIVSTLAMRGLSLYEPTELVMSARVGTRVADIENELAHRGQMLAFEPVDLGPALGVDSREATIGSLFACNLSGSRRIAIGAARDHLIGVKAITGTGDEVKSGGRVMKNVTGVDLVKALAGSWGTLAALTEVTFKVAPIPEETRTLMFAGLTEELAVEAMTSALGTPYEVSGAVHIDGALAQRLHHPPAGLAGRSLTALRTENFSAFVAYRATALAETLAQFGEIAMLDDGASRQFWGELRRLTLLTGSRPLWRISVAPSRAPLVVSSIRRYHQADAFYDWSGGLIWLEVPDAADAGATDIRRVLATHGGHATLIRAEEAVRAQVDVFHPMELGIARLTRGLKEAFDPFAILNPGRMYQGI
ncbi:MAG: FAD-binding protein [Hyphomicrobiaceae bacterium]